MHVEKIEDLKVYQRALDLAGEISAIIKRDWLPEDWGVRNQLSDSSEAVPALIADGFEQSTDRFFAQLLYRAVAESCETRTHLRIARLRGYVTADERIDLCRRYEEVERMAAGLIRYLEKENRTHRRRPKPRSSKKPRRSTRHS